jgi:putative hydrolase of the HAD superfamily
MQEADVIDMFHEVEVVHEKNQHVYKRILNKYKIQASEFVMVGDSINSDIIPVLAIGGWAIHVPNDFVWSHEGTQAPETNDRYRRVASIELVERAIEGIEGAP